MDDNPFKSLHGQNSLENLGSILDIFKERGYIKSIEQPVKAGYENMDKQFYFQYMITFDDGEKWIIQSTTSIRDRINIQQWHSLHFKEIIKDINKSIIVYPDGIAPAELKTAIRYHKKITNRKIFSAIDYVISINMLTDMIENKYMDGRNIGQQKALEGNNFEKKLVDILNSPSNLIKWNEDREYETGYSYPYFCVVLNGIGILAGTKIKEIKATREISQLLSRGKPKTDILLHIKFEDDSEKDFTYSCKRTSSKWVSVHQYSADKFINVLGITDERLKNALLEFQYVGGVKALSKRSTEILVSEMPKYNRQLAMWAYGGINGEGDPDIHWARYVITFKNETSTLSVIKLEDYVNTVLSVEGQFGTPFNWTFASKQKGKSIQLKGKVI